ncbi:MAG: hypothetical protein JOZ78_12500 [Chroococcidiopsidaceae cyanobacterium CP_BM_ER_R8_30]|nr:hypothetical protein [Chroococcidiopsidaceae cyanobacterium CP_BM_ER_R8_30]
MTEPKNLERARQLFAKYAESGSPLSYFDALYQESQRNPHLIPWARLEPNPFLVSWVEHKPRAWQGWRCLKIGCGLGDDAEYLAGLGAAVLRLIFLSRQSRGANSVFQIKRFHTK